MFDPPFDHYGLSVYALQHPFHVFELRFLKAVVNRRRCLSDERSWSQGHTD